MWCWLKLYRENLGIKNRISWYDQGILNNISKYKKPIIKKELKVAKPLQYQWFLMPVVTFISNIWLHAIFSSSMKFISGIYSKRNKWINKKKFNIFKKISKSKSRSSKCKINFSRTRF